MEIDIRREIVTCLEDGKLKELFERDCKQGRFWFRLYLNNCRNVDELFSHLLLLDLFEFQARNICLEFGEHRNNRGENLSDICGVKEGVEMSFMVSASSEEELEEKMNFFIEGARKLKEAVNEGLSQKTPEWAKKGIFISA